jgi:hypothetical protein
MINFTVDLYRKYINIKAKEISKFANERSTLTPLTFVTCIISWYELYILYETRMFSSPSQDHLLKITAKYVLPNFVTNPSTVPRLWAGLHHTFPRLL